VGSLLQTGVTITVEVGGRHVAIDFVHASNELRVGLEDVKIFMAEGYRPIACVGRARQLTAILDTLGPD